VDHFLSYRTVRTANGDILQGPAETAHEVPFEVGEHHHRVVIQHVFANRNFDGALYHTALSALQVVGTISSNSRLGGRTVGAVSRSCRFIAYSS